MGEKLIEVYDVILFCFPICQQSQEINKPTSTVISQLNYGPLSNATRVIGPGSEKASLEEVVFEWRE